MNRFLRQVQFIKVVTYFLDHKIMIWWRRSQSNIILKSLIQLNNLQTIYSLLKQVITSLDHKS